MAVYALRKYEVWYCDVGTEPLWCCDGDSHSLMELGASTLTECLVLAYLLSFFSPPTILF